MRWRSRATSRERLGAACKSVRNQRAGEFSAARPEKVPRIFPFGINSLQGSAASLLSCAPIVEREMPPPDAWCSRPLNRATAKSALPHCACQWSENTEKLQETCTRPICMHAKTPVTSVACGIRGRRFYLALCPSHCITTASVSPLVSDSSLCRDIMRRSLRGASTARADYRRITVWCVAEYCSTRFSRCCVQSNLRSSAFVRRRDSLHFG